MLYAYMSYVSISSILKQAGHDVEIFVPFGFSESRFIAEICRFRPDVVGFSLLTPGRQWALRVARRVKREIDAVTLFGNIETLLDPTLINEDGVDIVCRWEGEAPARELANRIDRGESFDDIPGLWVKSARGITRNGMPADLVDLDALPFQDLALYDKYGYFRNGRILPIVNGRGCPYHCTYCFNSTLRAHYGGPRWVRKRRPERAVEEIEFHVRHREVRSVLIIDEVLWLDNDWLREFLKLFKERINKPIIGNFRFGPLDEADISALAEAGVKTMILATETADESQRKRLFGKNVSNEEILSVARRLKSAGIAFACSCFFGLPGETVKGHVDGLKFFRAVNPEYLWGTFFQPYPGLPLTKTPLIQSHLPAGLRFMPTYHHEMCLNIPDKKRLTNLKKVYFLCMRWPRLAGPLVWLTKFNLPIFFDLLFLCHFAYYSFVFEDLSAAQFVRQVMFFAAKAVAGPNRRGAAPRSI